MKRLLLCTILLIPHTNATVNTWLINSLLPVWHRVTPTIIWHVATITTSAALVAYTHWSCSRKIYNTNLAYQNKLNDIENRITALNKQHSQQQTTYTKQHKEIIESFNNIAKRLTTLETDSSSLAGKVQKILKDVCQHYDKEMSNLQIQIEGAKNYKDAKHVSSRVTTNQADKLAKDIHNLNLRMDGFDRKMEQMLAAKKIVIQPIDVNSFIDNNNDNTIF